MKDGLIHSLVIFEECSDRYCGCVKQWHAGRMWFMSRQYRCLAGELLGCKMGCAENYWIWRYYQLKLARIWKNCIIALCNPYCNLCRTWSWAFWYVDCSVHFFFLLFSWFFFGFVLFFVCFVFHLFLMTALT